MYVSLAMVGILYGSFLPLCFAFGAELTFPLQPALVVASMMMVAYGYTFPVSVLSAHIVGEREGDHLLDEDELIEIKRWRSLCVLSMIIPVALIACALHIIAKPIALYSMVASSSNCLFCIKSQ